MTNRDRGLALHEEITLLALRDDAGTFVSGSMYTYAIAGALLAELVLRERISVDRSKKKPLIQVVDARPIEESILDACLTKIREAKKPASAQTWVSRLAGIEELAHHSVRGLCEKGILRADRDTILLVFSRRIYPEIDPAPEQELIARLHSAIFADTDTVEPKTAVLVSLANSSGLLRTAFDKRDLARRKARIERITNGEVIGEATQQAIAAVQAALLVTCIVPTIITTAVTR